MVRFCKVSDSTKPWEGYRRRVSGLFIVIVTDVMRHTWKGLNYQLAEKETSRYSKFILIKWMW